MTAYLMTPEQHAQILDAMDFICQDSEREVPQITLCEAFAMLKAMKPVEPVGYKFIGEATSEVFGTRTAALRYIEDVCLPEHANYQVTPLYAMETKT